MMLMVLSVWMVFAGQNEIAIDCNKWSRQNTKPLFFWLITYFLLFLLALVLVVFRMLFDLQCERKSIISKETETRLVGWPAGKPPQQSKVAIDKWQSMKSWYRYKKYVDLLQKRPWPKQTECQCRRRDVAAADEFMECWLNDDCRCQIINIRSFVRLWQ